MDELIARLEAATGPSREFDGEIALLLGWTFQKMKGDARQYWRRPGVKEYYLRANEGPPPYTASVDHAETLVPDRCGYEVRSFRHMTLASIINDQTEPDGEGQTGPTFSRAHIVGRHPALALTLAALKARRSA